MDKLYLGTCSWKYPSWDGLVYSSREPGNYLAEYARHYDTVEVDQWFWSLGKSGAALPRLETVAEYDLSTPPEFRFTVKCPNALTLTHHHGKKGEPLHPNERFLDHDFFMRFLESLAVLVPKIGLFIFQFEYLNKDKMPSRNQFMDSLGVFLSGLPGDMPYAVEIRNPRWMDDSWFKLLQGHGAAPVLLQGYWMDDVAVTMDRYAVMLGDTVCIRLHGEDREGMEERTGSDWSCIIRPKDDELQRISGAVSKLLGAGKKAFVNVNNHYEGSAPLTIQKLRRLLDAL
ncbi:MAG: DUF72 domain-containing protein [Spirochaetia bacterium]|jgi:uncharacterized protein YecE (DUF72 family)|nr:DUF72 domain-containing protein [Spirochaetia bacterium]